MKEDKQITRRKAQHQPSILPSLHPSTYHMVTPGYCTFCSFSRTNVTSARSNGSGDHAQPRGLVYLWLPPYTALLGVSHACTRARGQGEMRATASLLISLP